MDVIIDGKQITGWRKYPYALAIMLCAVGVFAGAGVVLVVLGLMLLLPVWLPALLMRIFA